MKRWHVFTCILAACAMMPALTGTAQDQGQSGSSQYQPAVPAPTTVNAYGGYPGFYGGTTAAGSAMNGMANAISAKGNYNLSTSAAAVNMTQAQKNEIQNRQLYENTYFQMKETNQAYQRAHAKPHPTEEQLARLAREGEPQPVSPSQVDPVSGQVKWPAALLEDSFAPERGQIEQLLAKKASQGALSITDEMAARQAIESMFADLKLQIKQLPPMDYVQARDFLQSMIYATAHSTLH